MDSNNTKQIIIAYHAIENAIDAILKPIRIELYDAEIMSAMPKEQEDTLWYIHAACGAIQKVLGKMADGVGDLEESCYDDGEIEKAGEMIRDILFDIKPPPNTLENTNMVEFTEKVVMGVK